MVLAFSIVASYNMSTHLPSRPSPISILTASMWPSLIDWEPISVAKAPVVASVSSMS